VAAIVRIVRLLLAVPAVMRLRSLVFLRLVMGLRLVVLLELRLIVLLRLIVWLLRLLVPMILGSCIRLVIEATLIHRPRLRCHGSRYSGIIRAPMIVVEVGCPIAHRCVPMLLLE